MTAPKFWVLSVILLLSQCPRHCFLDLEELLEDVYKDEWLKYMEDMRVSKQDEIRHKFFHDSHNENHQRNTMLYDTEDECTPNVMYHYKPEDTTKLLHNLEKIIDFFEKYSQLVIVDGLFGMRAVEGVFQNVLKKASKTHPLYNPIQKLYNKLHNICEKIFKIHQKNTGDEYTQSFLKITEKPFVLQLPWKNFNTKDVWPITQNEKESDRCVKGMIGFHHENCYIDEKCWKEEMRTGTKGYYLTHQILFLMAGEAKGCHNKIASYIGGEHHLSRWYHRAGSNIYAQMMSNAYALKTSAENELMDITVEQGMICQSLGVVECYRMDLLRQTLDWVNAEGCVEDNDNDEEEDSHKRVRRVDVPIGKCSQHLTAVLMGFYANHLPFILHPPPCHMLQRKDLFKGLYK